MDQTQHDTFGNPVTTFTNFSKKEIKKLKKKSAEKAVLKQLSNIEFQVENLRKVAIFTEFDSFFEAHQTFQNSIKELIETTQIQIKSKASAFLNGSEGAIMVHQNINKMCGSFLVAVNDLKLRRQSTFSDHINKYIKELNLEISDYSQRIKSEPMYKTTIKPYLTLFSTDFKQLYSQVTRLLVPLQFEQIQQKTTTRLTEALKNLTSTLSTQLLPSVSHSRTAKLITEIFIEKFTKEFTLFIQSINAIPLFNERITFLEQAMSELSKDFNMYIADIKGEQSKTTQPIVVERKIKTREIPEKEDVRDDAIKCFVLESENAKLKDKIDSLLLSLANAQQQNENARSDKEQTISILLKILAKMRPLVRNDPTNASMETSAQIFALIDQIALEQKDARTIFLKEKNLRDKLQAAYARLGKREDAENMSNIELVDGIRDQEEKLIKKKDELDELRKKLKEACKNGGATKQDVKGVPNAKLVDILEAQRNALSNSSNENDAIRKKLIDLFEKGGGNGEEANNLTTPQIIDEIDKQREALANQINEIKPKLVDCYVNGGGNEKTANQMSCPELVDAIEKQRMNLKGELQQFDGIRDKLINCYVKGGGKEEDTDEMNNGEIISGIAFFLDKIDKIREKLINAYVKAGGRREVTDDMNNEELVDAISNLLDSQNNIHQKLVDCYVNGGGAKENTEDRDNSSLIDLISELLESGDARTKNQSEAGQKLRKRLIECYEFGGGDKELLPNMSNIQVIDAIQSFLSDERTNHKKLLDLYALGGGDPKKYESSPNTPIIDALLSQQRQNQDDNTALRNVLLDSFAACGGAKDDAKAMDNLQVATYVNEKLKSLLKDNVLFRGRLIEAYVKAGGSREKASDMDNDALLQNLVKMQNVAYIHMMKKVHDKLAALAGKLTGEDCSNISTDDLLDVIERNAVKPKTKVVEKVKTRKTKLVMRNNEEIVDFLPQTSECEAIIEVLVRITGKKSKNYREKNPQQLLEIALPKIDQIIASNIDGTSLVFQQIKDLLPPETMQHEYIQALREMVIKRTSTNTIAKKFTAEMVKLSKLLNNRESCLPTSETFEEFQSTVKGIQEEIANIIPSEVERDVHGMIINASDAISKMSMLLASSEYAAQQNESMKYTDDLLTKNLSLTQNVSRLRKLLEEKDNQLDIEAGKLQTAEKTFKKFAEANKALTAKSLRDIKAMYTDEKNEIEQKQSE